MVGVRVMLLSGNEAIARGAWEAGVKLAAGYPGTPSTEILEELAKYREVYSEWSPNEKVAMEVGLGAALAGARALVCMKHVGLNVAADPFFSASYVGVEGGLVVVTADDPGMHSSQDEQDNRNFAKFARVPLLEPSDSAEARDFVTLAFSLSERFDTPVLLRTTTRTSHSKSVVELGDRVEPAPVLKLTRNYLKYSMLPANAMARHPLLEQRMSDLAEYAETCPLNRVEIGDSRVGIISAGAAYGYAREALPGASYLKLGLAYPLPAKLVARFRSMVEKLYVVEELDPFLEELIRLMEVRIDGGKELNTRIGEIDPGMIARGLVAAGAAGVNQDLLAPPQAPVSGLPPRPPTLCPGCAHRGIFTVLKKMRVFVCGDIGCYTLGALPPFGAIHASTCMGAGIGMAHGMSKVIARMPAGGAAGLRGSATAPPEVAAGKKKAPADLRNKPIAIIGDSTFFHSGITPLMNVAYNRGSTLTVILDNNTTAMTGGQEHPGTGKTLLGEPSSSVDIPALCRALGIQRVTTVDPYDLAEVERVLREELAADEASVVIAKAPCVLEYKIRRPGYDVETELCIGCKRCLQAGCAALSLVAEGDTQGTVVIDAFECDGCGVCAQLCPESAIVRPESGVTGAGPATPGGKDAR